MKLDMIQTIITKGDELLLVSTRKKRIYQDLMDTGAVVEQGVILETKYNVGNEELRLESEIEETNTKPLLPYKDFGKAFCPTASKEETLDLYKAIKKYASINEELDVRQYESIKKRIDKFAYNMFWGKENGSTSAKLKGATFFIWSLAGTLNVLSGKAFLASIQYLCAAVQIDYFQLIPMIMASTISPEKKKLLLETIKGHYINPDAIDKENKYIALYTKLHGDDKRKILRKAL